MTISPAILAGRRKRWRVAPPPNYSAVKQLSHLPAIVAALLARRGIATPDEARRFLDVDETLFEDPFTLPDAGRAVLRLTRARREGELVAVYGDFDADGVTGTALLTKALRRYGLNVVPYIPHRVTEGHGLNARALDALALKGVRLVVTVDCGVTDVAPVAHAMRLGMDVIITDHHTVNGPLPGASAVINPRAPGSTYGFDHLTGVGMALKLSQALLGDGHGAGWDKGLLELAAIGTVTDMAPVLGENRYIVHHGLRHLRETESVGLRTLMQLARVQLQHANAETIGFAIGPRLNAAGRLDSAGTALDLLLTADAEHALELAASLEGHNGQRQKLTEDTMNRCREQVLARPTVPPLLIVGSRDFNPGVVGLAAGKLAEEFGVPAVVYALDGNKVMASCRSGPGFHWARALAMCGELLERHGGHAQAAGFTCEASRLDELRDRLDAIAGEWMGERPAADESVVDAEVDLPQVMGRTFQVLQRMGPFGMGNPAPLFLTRGMQVDGVSTMGADARHFRMRLRAGGAQWDAVAFRQAWVPGTERADIVYSLDVDTWGGSPRLRVNIQDFAPAS